MTVKKKSTDVRKPVTETQKDSNYKPEKDFVRPNEGTEDLCEICGAPPEVGCVHRTAAAEAENEAADATAQADVDAIWKIFEEMENRPSDEIIESWKKEIGSPIYFTLFSENTVLVYRSIRRAEYKALMAQNLSRPVFEEKVFDTCRLWPRQVVTAQMDAGIVTSGCEAIMTASKFMGPEELIALTREL